MLPPPSSERSAIAEPPPTAVTTAPAVVDIALAVIRRSGSTTCGWDADSADSTNRLTEMTTSALSVEGLAVHARGDLDAHPADQQRADQVGAQQHPLP